VVARYAVRQDEAGWTVVDTLLDQPVIADGEPLAGLPHARAEILASLLNWRVRNDDAGATE